MTEIALPPGQEPFFERTSDMTGERSSDAVAVAWLAWFEQVRLRINSLEQRIAALENP